MSKKKIKKSCESCMNLIAIGSGDHICYECGDEPIMPIMEYEPTDDYMKCGGEMMNPCINCPERTPGCSTRCPTGMEQAKKDRERRDRIKAAKEKENAPLGHIVDTANRIRNGRWR